MSYLNWHTRRQFDTHEHKYIDILFTILHYIHCEVRCSPEQYSSYIYIYIHTIVYILKGIRYSALLWSRTLWASEVHYIGAREVLKYTVGLYRSALTPKPGPGGGSHRLVSPPAGSQEKRPFLEDKKKRKECESKYSIFHSRLNNKTLVKYIISTF